MEGTWAKDRRVLTYAANPAVGSPVSSKTLLTAFAWPSRLALCGSPSFRERELLDIGWTVVMTSSFNLAGMPAGRGSRIHLPQSSIVALFKRLGESMAVGARGI